MGEKMRLAKTLNIWFIMVLVTSIQVSTLALRSQPNELLLSNPTILRLILNGYSENDNEQCSILREGCEDKLCDSLCKYSFRAGKCKDSKKSCCTNEI